MLAALPLIRQRSATILALTDGPDAPVGRAADMVLATVLPGDPGEEAYIIELVFPGQLVVERVLVAAAVTARQAVVGDDNDGTRGPRTFRRDSIDSIDRVP